MTDPSGQTPTPPEYTEVPTDDPEWIKGVVARALLRATDDADPLPPTPTGPVPATWPEMQTETPTLASTTPAVAPTPTPPPELMRTLTDNRAKSSAVAAPPQTAAPAVAPPNPQAPTATPAPATSPAPQRPVAPPTAPAPMSAPQDTRPVPQPAPAPAPTRELTPMMSGSVLAEPVSELPEGVQDRRESSVSVASGGRATDDQLLVHEEATTEGFRSSDLRTVLEWLAVIVAALTVALLIKAFVLQAFWIPSESMETTVNKGDRILVNKVSYRLHEVRRGDLVVFKKLPGTGGTTEDLIKRAVALPGETIEVRDDGRIWIWGPGETPDQAKRLDEPYLSPDDAFLTVPRSSTDPTAFGNANCVNGDSPTRCTLDDSTYFMMGDNRNQSQDSRFFGPVPEENIVGRAFLRIWPLSDIDTL